MILKIMTLNTWQERGPWQERWEIIFKGLKTYLPDIIGFQEVFNMDWADEIQKRSGYPYLIKSGQNSGLVFLSKYPTLKSECLVMETKSPTEDYFRYGHFALFQIGDKQLGGLNTHLSWKLPEDDVRLQQTQELMKFMDCQETAEAFWMGDFNSDASRPSVKSIQDVWEDAYAVLHPEDPGLTWDYKNSFAARAQDRMPERRIDYIFTQRLEGKAKRSEIVFNQPNANGVYASDHFGVMTELKL